MQRLQQATKLIDSTRAGIARSCKILQTELQETLKFLPKGASTATPVLATLIVVAALVGTAVIYLNQTAVEVVIKNQGCNTLIMPVGISFPVPGVQLPEDPIPPGGQGVAKVPRVTLNLDATNRDSVAVLVLGVPIPVNVGRQYASVKLDGAELLGTRTTIQIGSRKQHELVISCQQR